ncbi:mechanosensitive ion channel family protein [Brachybacterium sp. JHP9]|uniref:Mechanosensitive ion channel family protein n=1 Tax=Brachybacterium equifaecis TaxID=2910770 RepID=A0ABT0QY70_9MICO|nr:mechanosensitive ion channel domain-containing protein [Brachybacterium equifaecis]MCL6421969.1 mechanosensitive ion channel family protein [Brachybacterium equifaecis]
MDLVELLSAPSTEGALSLADRIWTWLLSSGVTVVIIIVAALILRMVAAWLIRRFFRTMREGGTRLSSMTSAMAGRDQRTARMAQQRRAQRISTLTSVSVNIASIVIGIVALVMVLSALGVNVSPLIASLGVAGLAAGIGAQTIIKDMIAGMLILFEDIVAVGDTVDFEYASGTVEAVSLRATQIRALDGTLWTVRNGEVIRIGNKSRGFATAVVTLDIDSGADNTVVSTALAAVADDLASDEAWADLIDPPVEVSGILSVDGARMQRRVTVKTVAGQQWAVEMELRRRIRIAFRAAEIDFALPRFEGSAKA